MLKRKNIFALMLTGIFASSAFASDYQTVQLHLQADQGTENYLKSICISTNNGFTKSCGDGAVRKYGSGEKSLSIVTWNLRANFGYDDSCQKLRYAMKTPSAKGQLDVYTTVHQDIVNHVKIVAITNCSTAWSPQ